MIKEKTVIVLMIKAIIGLGNPGDQYYKTRHNIGFRVVDTLAEQQHVSWRTFQLMDTTEIVVHNNRVLLIKPMTYMNSSGKVIPMLLKKGIKQDEILVVHDELELPFGQIKFKFGGSAKGHNGLKSIIESCGPNFYRLRMGIGRPERKEDVPDYVLKSFNEPTANVEQFIELAVQEIFKQEILL